jgi:hypothetical protein
MAQIDLKNAYIRLKDGYSLPGAVNNVAGYTIGATTIAVDGIVGAVVTGNYFGFAGHNTRYQITAHTETTGNTTGITFTPALTATVADNEVITIGPHQLDVKIGEGNLTYSEKRKVDYTLDRGKIDTVRLGDEQPVEVKMDFTWEFLRADTGQPPTVEDALKQRGVAASWISSSNDLCEPYALDIEVEYVPPCGGEKREIITLVDFRHEDLGHDLRQGQVSVSGKCNATEAIIVRAAA